MVRVGYCLFYTRRSARGIPVGASHLGREPYEIVIKHHVAGSLHGGRGYALSSSFRRRCRSCLCQSATDEDFLEACFLTKPCIIGPMLSYDEQWVTNRVRFARISDGVIFLRGGECCPAQHRW